MTGIQTWTAASATLALMFLVVALCDQESMISDPSSAEDGGREIVRKEKHPYRSRQKREWIWNSYYVTEETEMISPKKIGKVGQQTFPSGLWWQMVGEEGMGEGAWDWGGFTVLYILMLLGQWVYMMMKLNWKRWISSTESLIYTFHCSCHSPSSPISPVCTQPFVLLSYCDFLKIKNGI